MRRNLLVVGKSLLIAGLVAGGGAASLVLLFGEELGRESASAQLTAIVRGFLGWPVDVGHRTTSTRPTASCSGRTAGPPFG
jgi:hypothetical protein